MKKKLASLTRVFESPEIIGKRNVWVTGIVDDNRQVKKGDLFVAIKGFHLDAHRFISSAISRGASVIVGERIPKGFNRKKATFVKVKNSRRALGLLAAAWYSNPSKKMKVIGVTGTDGKTTTASMIYSILNTAGHKTAVISTIGAKIGKKEFDTGLHVTNPEPLQLQKLLAEMRDEGCKYVVLEVTSHGLDQERVTGVDFKIAVITNITPEHIDYHKTFAAYRKAKAELLKKAKTVVLNRDDKSYLYLKNVIKGNNRSRIVTYGVENKNTDFHGQETDYPKNGIKMMVTSNSLTKQIDTNLLGTYNLLNLLAAIAVVRQLKIPWQKIIKTYRNFQLPTGRLEEIENNRGCKIYVDFAHTPYALECVLGLLKQRTEGKLITVFGCAGERDIQKRPLMGEIAAEIADFSVFTAEDPRNERLRRILSQIIRGAKKGGAKEFNQKAKKKLDNKQNYYTSIPERGRAISFAIQRLAKRNDTVVICGKGHEKSMAYGNKEYPWSDQKAVSTALKGEVMKIERK